ncbi:MAG: hypothetical protein M1497_02855 [Nitrospirae bacterium]|nr:hypothetical protein [Nitrospirota bacterium]
MKRKLLTVVLLSLSVAVLWGCGGSGPGAPGSGGSTDTGITPTVTLVTHSDPNEDQGDVWEIDLIQDLCSADTPEVWGNDYAHVTIHGDTLNPNGNPNNALYITNYRVTFVKQDPSLPTIEQINSGSMSGMVILPGDDNGPFTFMILDTGRKDKIYSDIVGGINPHDLPLLYNMKLELWGQDNFGNNFTVAPIIRMINISDFNHCS